MKITDIKVKKLNNTGRLIGQASITLDDCLVIHGIQLIQLDTKRFVRFPNKEIQGKIVDTVHPITHEFRNYVEESIFNFFDKLEEK